VRRLGAGQVDNEIEFGRLLDRQVAGLRLSLPKGSKVGMKTFDPGCLAVETGGAGDPAVFVHGFGSNKLIWRDVCEGLRGVFSFHAIDLPGCGESPTSKGFRYTLKRLADVLTDFIVMKDLKNLTLVGASLGGTIILLAVLRNAHELASRVRALCLIGAPAYPQEIPFGMEVLRSPLGPLALDPPLFLLFPPLAAGLLSAVYRQNFGRRRARKAMIKTARLIKPKQLARYVPRFKTIHLPTLLIWGREDDVVPVRFGRRLARDLPNARLIVFEQCAHRPHQECPAEVVAALKEFARACALAPQQRLLPHTPDPLGRDPSC
jgi:pimeloyl-ACP methyl ester carboxylesterase